MLTDRAAPTPVLLVLEDLHWADTSTLDLVVFLAHNLDDRRILLLATYRADEPASAERMHRLAGGVRRSGSPCVSSSAHSSEEAMRRCSRLASDAPLPPALINAIIDRARRQSVLRRGAPRRRRRPQRRATARPARPTAAARGPARPSDAEPAARGRGRRTGRRVPSAARGCAVARARRCVSRCARRWSRASSSPIGRAAASASAMRSWRRRSTRRSCPVSARNCTLDSPTSSPAAERRHRRSSRRIGRPPVDRAEALVASVEAARQAEAVFGLAEALAHLERALALWDTVPDAPELAGIDLAQLCCWAAELASQTGAAPRAVEFTQQAIELVDESDPLRVALLLQRLGRYLFESGRGDILLAAFERAVEIVPAHPPSAERAQALAALGSGLQRRLAPRRVTCHLRAGARSRACGGRERCRGPGADTLGSDLAYLGRAEEGLAQLEQALEVAEQNGDPLALLQAYVLAHRRADDARTATRVGPDGRSRGGGDAPLRDGHTVLAANWIEALLAIGEWDQRRQGQCRRTPRHHRQLPPHASKPGRHRARPWPFDTARAHLDAARRTVREDRGLATYDGYVAELALWEHRWTDAEEAVRDGMALARHAMGNPDPRLALRERTARPSRAGCVRPRPPRRRGRRHSLDRARNLLTCCSPRRSRRLDDHTERRRLARLGRGGVPRARGVARPELWSAGRSSLGPARTPAPRRVLSMAPSRGTHHRRRVPYRGESCRSGRRTP